MSAARRKRRKRRRSLPCECGGRLEWREGAHADESYYKCGSWDADAGDYVGGCGRFCAERDAPAPDDGRIREADDVPPIIEAAREVARDDTRLSSAELAIFERLCQRGIGLKSLYVFGASRWLADELDLHRTTTRRALARLVGFGYVRQTPWERVPLRRIRDIIHARRIQGLTPPTVYELRRAPDPLPICTICLGDIDEAQRVSAIYCGDACRQRAHRMHANRQAGAAKARAARAAKASSSR